MRQIALRLLIVSVALSALLGIWALLAGDFGATEAKILLTTLCVSGASLLAMASAAAWERGELARVGPAGILLSAAGFGLLVVGLWAELGEDWIYKAGGTGIYLATAAAHASLVSLARLAPRFAWLRPTAFVLALVVAVYLAVLTWAESEEPWPWRWFGVFAILLASATVLVPVFQRLSRDDAPPDLDTAPARHCPACGAQAASHGDVVRCGACGAAHRVTRLA